ncbi:MAG: YceI family protein [Bacteroidota bacterium]
MKNNLLEEITLSLMVPFVLMAFFRITSTENTVHQPAHTTYRAKAVLGAGSVWQITEDYEIRFSTRGAEGSLRNLRGNIQFNEPHLNEAKFDVAVEVATISTGNKKKDEHARGKKWLDAASFPEIKFISSAFEKQEEAFLVTGTLEIRGIRKEVTFPFQFSRDENKGLFEGRLTINREDFKIDGPMMAFMVGNKVEIELKVPVIQ